MYAIKTGCIEPADLTPIIVFFFFFIVSCVAPRPSPRRLWNLHEHVQHQPCCRRGLQFAAVERRTFWRAFRFFVSSGHRQAYQPRSRPRHSGGAPKRGQLSRRRVTQRSKRVVVCVFFFLFVLSFFRLVQVERVRAFWQTLVKDEQCGLLYVSGRPGCGKSASIDQALRGAEHWCTTNVSSKCLFVWLNCMDVSTVHEREQVRARSRSKTKKKKTAHQRQPPTQLSCVLEHVLQKLDKQAARSSALERFTRLIGQKTLCASFGARFLHFSHRRRAQSAGARRNGPAGTENHLCASRSVSARRQQAGADRHRQQPHAASNLVVTAGQRAR